MVVRDDSRGADYRKKKSWLAAVCSVGIVACGGAETPEAASPPTVQKNENAALIAHCKGGSSTDCLSLANLYIKAGDARDGELALLQACQFDDAGACSLYGAYLMSGEHGFPKQQGHAAALFIKACQRNDDDGCAYLAIATQLGFIEPPNPAMAFRMLRSRCPDAQNAVFSCIVLGGFYENGVGTSVDPKSAKYAYLIACQRGNLDACDMAEKIRPPP